MGKLQTSHWEGVIPLSVLPFVQLATYMGSYTCVRVVQGVLSDVVEVNNLHTITPIRFSYSFAEKMPEIYITSALHWIMVHNYVQLLFL